LKPRKMQKDGRLSTKVSKKLPSVTNASSTRKTTRLTPSSPKLISLSGTFLSTQRRATSCLLRKNWFGKKNKKTNLSPMKSNLIKKNTLLIALKDSCLNYKSKVMRHVKKIKFSNRRKNI